MNTLLLTAILTASPITSTDNNVAAKVATGSEQTQVANKKVAPRPTLKRGIASKKKRR